VFLIDDFQKITSNGVDIDFIKNFAKKNNIETVFMKLRHQIRSQGNNDYENWVYNLFSDTPIKYKNNNEFSIKIFDDISRLENDLNKQNNKKLLAGFTWEWNNPNKDGSLPLDIVIDECNWKKPWNNKNLLKTKEYFKFYEDTSLDEVACIYTAQGIEYDNIGLIIGYDLDYSFEEDRFLFLPDKNKDNNVTEKEIRNLYITLLSRVKKGMYIFSVNKNVTRRLRMLVE
jgi:DUF2075 family protein